VNDAYESHQIGPTIHIWMDHDGTWHREELPPPERDDTIGWLRETEPDRWTISDRD